MMGKHDGWLTSQEIEKNGLCDSTTIDHYRVEGIIAKEYTRNDPDGWRYSPDIPMVIEKAKAKRIHLKYAFRHMDEIKALPNDYFALVDAAHNIPCDYSDLARCLREHEVPGVRYVDGRKLLKIQLINKCKNKNRKELFGLFEKLDITNTDPGSIKFREEFEAELEASDKASKSEITEPISKSESIEESEFIQSNNSDTFYRQGHKFRIEMLDTSEIINQTNHNIKILQAISKDLNMPMLSTFCDQILDKLNSIHLQSKVINNYSYMLEYVDDDPNPILLPRLPRRSEEAVA